MNSLSALVLAVLLLLAAAWFCLGARWRGRQSVADRALLESEARFRDFTELASDWYWEQDAAFRFQLSSKGSLKNPNFIIGKARWELPIVNLSQTDWQAHRAQLERHEPFHDLVYAIDIEPGERRWHSVSGKPYFDAAGNFCGYRGTGRDITVQVQAEEAMRKRAEELRLIYDTADVAIFNVDTRGLITHANRRMAQMFACPMETLIGSEYVAHVHPDEREIGRQRMLSLLASDIDAVSHERYYQRDDGRAFWGQLNGRRRHDAGGATLGLVGVIADHTERKQAQDQLRELNESLERKVAERTRELEAFSYSVAHDLRAPLRAIDGFSLLVMNDNAGRLDAASLDHLQRVRAAAQRLGDLIDDLLELARVSRAPVTREALDLGLLAGEAFDALQEAEPQRHVSWSAPGDLRAHADRLLTRLLLDNLIGNAWKYTGRNTDAVKPPEIEFGRAGSGQDGAFFVRDNGSGFDMTFVDKIFQPFERLHHRDEFEGSGIGLSIAQRIVERHGGRIWAEGAPGKGATFYFTLG